MLFSSLMNLALIASVASALQKPTGEEEIKRDVTTTKISTVQILSNSRRLAPKTEKKKNSQRDVPHIIPKIPTTSNLRGNGRQSNPCVLMQLIAQLENGDEESKWRCQLSDEDKAKAGRRFIDIEGLTEADLAKAESGRSTFFSDEAQLSDNTLNVPPHANKAFGVSNPKRPGRAKKQSQRDSKHNGVPIRDRTLLHETIDNRVVVATRVNANDASTGLSLVQLKDDLFGIGTDPVNLVERFDTCSYGAMRMEAFDGTTLSNFKVNDGVTQVTINNNVVGANVFDIEGIVEAALESQLGSLDSQFDHVILCLPPGSLFGGREWIAYAYLNSFLSVYNNEWCKYVSAQVHEVGHNLNLRHSNDWFDGEYEDQIGFMGYSYPIDDQLMCYNAPKNYELGWYGHATIDLDLLNSGGFNGRFIGIDDYDPASTGEGPYVIATVKQSTSNLRVYVSYNAAKGINAATVDARNRVAVHITFQDSGAFSYNLGELSTGNRLALTNFEDSSDLIISFNFIANGSEPLIADVNIYLEGCPSGSCVPTASPVPSEGPSSSPTVATEAPSVGPSTAPSSSPSAGPTSDPTGSTEPPSTGPSSEETALSEPPSHGPSSQPSAGPSPAPSFTPSDMPSDSPTPGPSDTPSWSPSSSPTHSPTTVATEDPSSDQSEVPTVSPSSSPSIGPPSSTCSIDFNKDPCPGKKIAVCELRDGDQYFQTCQQVSRIETLLVGDTIPGTRNFVLAGCGCCQDNRNIVADILLHGAVLNTPPQFRKICPYQELTLSPTVDVTASPSPQPTPDTSSENCPIDEKGDMCPGQQVAVCELFKGDRYRQACLKPDRIEGLSIGDAIPGRPHHSLAGCGCCLDDPSIQNDIKSGAFHFQFGQRWKHICGF